MTAGRDLEPAGYAALLTRLKTEVRTAQAQAKRAAFAAAWPDRAIVPTVLGQPMAVANYVATADEAAQLSLPGPAELEAILSPPLADHPGATLADALPEDTSPDDQQ